MKIQQLYHLVDTKFPPCELVTICGFKNPAEVRKAAAKFSKGKAAMSCNDVAEWFQQRLDKAKAPKEYN